MTAKPPPTRDPGLERRLGDLYTEQDGRFDALARAAGLDPARDFRARDLRALRFAEADLRGFDFSGSDLRGTCIHLAARVDASTVLREALVDQADAAWLDQRAHPVDADLGALAHDLSRAIDRQQFELVFQPKVALKDRTVTGVEGLLRWHHPDRGFVAPAAFVPLLEERDLIEAVTYWTIEAAIERQRALRHRGFDIPVSLNISPMMMGRRDFIANCRRLVDGAGARLRFEVSETALVAEYDAVRDHIRDLDAIGISVAIDDYGAGLSSLALLKQSGAKELKIDGSFIRHLDDDQSAPLIVRSTIDLGHALAMEVTADGIEAPSQLTVLSVMGCDAAQGFVISRPLALDALVAWLETNPTIPVDVPSGEAP